MRKISIITLISLFFALCLVVINLALALEYKRQNSELNYFAFQRFIMAVRLSQDVSFEALNEQLKPLHVRISSMPAQTLYESGEPLLEDPLFEMMRYEKKLYFVPKQGFPPPPPPHGFKEFGMPPLPPMWLVDERIVLEDEGVFRPERVWILGVVINLLMVLFFSVVLRKLLRLRHLKRAIEDVGNAKKFQAIGVESEDELGEIAVEFNHAMEKIHHLKEARTLFLRNILHELKTPIMKGKIVCHSLENAKHQSQMERIFERLETLLEEMVKVEKLSSNEWVLEPKAYRMIDVLDHARDLLLCDTSRIEVHSQEFVSLILIDFELFATALKNLLDNALKHSTHTVDVRIEEGMVCIESVGEEIAKEKMDFSRPFNRAVEGSSTGLGLGLYIANAIIVKHGFVLEYLHVKGKNGFKISF
ncbi:ArsS family sensor histidine kinase [Sulfurospirillum barnesii]|uniref:histidine kinase n=1 Tax=Sulfurospirillum barnesii (strain ATCC 700032 / DSM 10660 / SES-3) TaxID=760154 RepID=I3Y020_SULBS|nr:ArsS family sensor histidine kinase [Sulfurospirillum barnesii]AFL69544.1 signal transduction histidine kinase [Sulfurospirillum barnesii SES-3]